jgi:DNA-binding PadR family transcriptional regulator
MSGRHESGLAQAEWAVLALIAERPTHGWALGTVLQPSGEIGQIWSGDRQRIYRALRTLDGLGLIEPAALEAGEGPHRAIYRITRTGRARLDGWLTEPVEPVREIHSSFMLKLVFLQRAGIDPIPLLNAQRALLVASVASLEHKLSGLGAAEKPHLRLRLKTTEAVIDFVDESCNAYAVVRPTRARRRKASTSG